MKRNNSFFSKVLIAEIMLIAVIGLVYETEAASPNSLEAIVFQTQIPDTVYSNRVISTVFLDGFAYPGAQIKYTLLDTVNNTQELIRIAETDINGEDIVDSLPVLKHYTGIDLRSEIAKDVIITNSGQGSDHFIRIKILSNLSTNTVSKEMFITNIFGQTVAVLPLTFNPAAETYDAEWHGQQVKTGIYTLSTKTNKGLIAKNFMHINNSTGVINYDAGVYNSNSNEDNSKSIREVVDELAASKYAIAITNDNLEDLLDTVLVKEDTYHDFYFNVTGTQYADGNVQGWIYYEDLSGEPNSADVEYKRLLDQTEIFTTTATNGYYQIDVPVVYEEDNPGQTKYIVTLSENGGDPFQTEIDTVLVSPGDNAFIHYVNQILPPDAELDIEGIVRNVYTKQPESGVTVRVINRSTNDLIEEDITGSDGAYEFLDIPQGTLLKFELGKTGELWMVNNEYDVPTTLTDTVDVLNRYFYPKTVEVPQVGTNSTIQGDGEEAAEMVGADYINFEEILRGVDNMWANGATGTYWSARTWIEDNFYEGNSPITTVNTQRDITTTMQQNYEPYTNFYPGQLGWNVNFGSGNTTSPFYSATNYGSFAVIGGEIMTTGQLQSYIKELQGRRLQLGSVSSRPSMMNSTATMPDEKDRAYVHLILLNQDGRFASNQESYSLENLTSTAPTMQANASQENNSYQKEKPLPSADYVEVVGNKPHSKTHFNQEKFTEQMQAQRQEQIENFIGQ